jgi:DNA-binding MarR family transcriptional regulator
VKCEHELVDSFLRMLQGYNGGWLAVRRGKTGAMTLDAGKGKFWDQAEVDAKLDVDLAKRVHVDIVVSIIVDGRRTEFVGEVLSYLSPGYVPEIKERVHRAALAAHAAGAVLEPPNMLVIAGYTSQATREELRNHDISYFDSAGSLYLRGDNFVVESLGKNFPPRFRRQDGGSLRLDSPKVSRIVRAVLADFSGGVRDMASAIGVDPSYVSRILRSLTTAGLIKRKYGGSIMNVSYFLEGEMRGELLDAWSSSPRPFWRKRDLYRLPEPDPDTLERKVKVLCRETGLRFALSLWSAANRYAEITTVPAVALYCDEPWQLPLHTLGAKPVREKENLWLLTPRDEGVFQFTQERNEIVTVHPVQLYYDLMHAPYRGESAAAMIRSQILGY